VAGPATGGVLTRLRQRRLDDLIAGSLLGAGMSLFALALEWGLRRRSQRR
jgi:hypothetical protein